VGRLYQMASAIAVLSVATTTKSGRDLLPYDEVRFLLWNWQRWAATHMPDLGVQPPPWAEQFIPKLCWDTGWGDYEEPVEAAIPKIDELSAAKMDKDLMRLSAVHLNVIKNHYLHTDRRQSREKVDAAIRALGDILG
jgi:hypothetical protein